MTEGIEIGIMALHHSAPHRSAKVCRPMCNQETLETQRARRSQRQDRRKSLPSDFTSASSAFSAFLYPLRNCRREAERSMLNLKSGRIETQSRKGAEAQGKRTQR